MPSSPKLFYALPSSYSRRSTALELCLLIRPSGLVFWFIEISRDGLGHDCKLGKTLSVSVRWDKAGAGSPDEWPKRHKVMCFLGIQTGFGSAGWRGALRRTWFPSHHEGLKRNLLCKDKENDCTFRLLQLVMGDLSHVDLNRHEPLSHLLGKEYFLHAYGPIYALSADVVSSLVTLRNNRTLQPREENVGTSQ